MKSLKYFVGVISIAALTTAAKNTNVTPSFRCQTELPTTTMEVLPSNGQTGDLKFHVIHHFGVQYMPIARGIVTQNDIASLVTKGEVLKKLGSEFSVPLKSKNCESFGPGLYSCFSAEPTDINGVKVSGYNFTTRVVNTRIYEYDYKNIEVVFSFYLEGLAYELPMSYAQEECVFK